MMTHVSSNHSTKYHHCIVKVQIQVEHSDNAKLRQESSSLKYYISHYLRGLTQTLSTQ